MGFLFKLPKHALSVCPGAWLGKGWEELLPRPPPPTPRDSDSLEQTPLTLCVGESVYILYIFYKNHTTLCNFILLDPTKITSRFGFCPPGSVL